MNNLHPVQLQILQRLMYSNGLRYSQLKPTGMEGSLFTFHLDKVVAEKLVAKKAKYTLTLKGKSIAGKMDLGDMTLKSQAKVSVILVCRQKNAGKIKYLLYTRLKSPFFNFQGFPTGKVLFGENILDCAKRELKEETGLVGTPKLFAIRHYQIHDKNRLILEDKIFFACKFENPKGTLKGGPEGKYAWVEKDKVWDFLKRPVQEIKDILETVENKTLTFAEKEYTTSGF